MIRRPKAIFENPPVARGRRPTILVLSDDALARLGIELVIRRAGFGDARMLAARDVDGAVQHAQAERIDFMVLHACAAQRLEADLPRLPAPARGVVLASPDAARIAVRPPVVAAIATTESELFWRTRLREIFGAHDGNRLTERQAQVLRLLMAGYSNKRIAGDLGVSPGTAKLHVAAVLRGIQARSRVELLIRMREGGLPADLEDHR